MERAVFCFILRNIMKDRSLCDEIGERTKLASPTLLCVKKKKKKIAGWKKTFHITSSQEDEESFKLERIKTFFF